LNREEVRYWRIVFERAAALARRLVLRGAKGRGDKYVARYVVLLLSRSARGAGIELRCVDELEPMASSFSKAEYWVVSTRDVLSALRRCVAEIEERLSAREDAHT